MGKCLECKYARYEEDYNVFICKYCDANISLSTLGEEGKCPKFIKEEEKNNE